jgi:hypothetical protein
MERVSLSAFGLERRVEVDAMGAALIKKLSQV